MPLNKTSSGFTLIEMLIVAPIVLLTIATFIGVLIYLTGETLIARTSNLLAYSVQDSLNSIENDVALSGAFLAVNNVAVTSPQGYNNVSQGFENVSSARGDMLILNSVATFNNADRTQRRIVPLKDTPHSCSDSAHTNNQPMTYNVVYFVKDDTLWRRTLMPSNYATKGCLPVAQRPSCAPAQTGTLCRTEDRKMLEGISSAHFKIEYFDAPSATAPLALASNASAISSTRQTSLSSADTVVITIEATKTVAGKKVSHSGTVRAARIGSLMEQVTPVP